MQGNSRGWLQLPLAKANGQHKNENRMGFSLISHHAAKAWKTVQTFQSVG